MYLIFRCRKCGHELYVEEGQRLGSLLGRIADYDCPSCGEDGYENWILLRRQEEGLVNDDT